MFDECIYFNLVALTRKINKIWQEEFERLGLTPSHGYLLFAIVKEPNASQKELSEILALDASTITRLIDNLVKKNLVDKKSRGKGAILSVTPAGEKEYLVIKETMDKLYNSMQKKFGKKEFSDLVNGLHAARTLL